MVCFLRLLFSVLFLFFCLAVTCEQIKSRCLVWSDISQKLGKISCCWLRVSFSFHLFTHWPQVCIIIRLRGTNKPVRLDTYSSPDCLALFLMFCFHLLGSHFRFFRLHSTASLSVLLTFSGFNILSNPEASSQTVSHSVLQADVDSCLSQTASPCTGGMLFAHSRPQDSVLML